MNKALAILIILLLAMAAPAAVKKKRFGIAAVAFRKGIDKGSAHMHVATKIYTVATLAGGIIIFVSGLLLFTNQFAGRV